VARHAHAPVVRGVREIRPKRRAGPQRVPEETTTHRRRRFECVECVEERGANRFVLRGEQQRPARFEFGFRRPTPPPPRPPRARRRR
jgi:hypothetical protein